ncbi:MAG TPA: MFS transporter [Pseudonocardia sp.]
MTTAPPATRSARHEVALWLVAATFFVIMGYSTVPTPLYPLYQLRDGFSPFVVTIVFGVYAVGVIASLLLAGHVSDWIGRRPILLGAVGIELVSAAVFILWPNLPGLIVGRLISGIGIGAATGTATAYLADLHRASRPGDGDGRFQLVSGAANLIGLGAGSLVAGALADWFGAPLVVTYVVFGVLLLATLVALWWSPETARLPREQWPRWYPQRVSSGTSDPLGFLLAGAAAFAAFAVFGLFTSLAPGFVIGALHHPSRLLAGFVAFLVFFAASAAQAATTSWSDRMRFLAGVGAEAIGLVLVAIGMNATSLAVFLVGGAAAGAGAGLLFKAAVGAVVTTAREGARGEALAGLFLIAYAGIAVPVVGVGVAVRFVAPTTAVAWFAGVFVVVLVGLGVARVRR